VCIVIGIATIQSITGRYFSLQDHSKFNIILAYFKILYYKFNKKSGYSL